MENYISLNIKSLLNENKLSQKEFGELFNLKQGAISAYIRNVAKPPIDIIIEICSHFDLSIDSFVKSEINEKSKYNSYVKNITNDNDNEVDCKMCEMYERMLEDKEKLIKALEREIASLRNEDYDAGQANQTA